MCFQDSKGDIYEKLLPSDNDGMTVIKNEFGEYCLFCQSGIKPIDTRTDKEKTIDAIFAILATSNKETYKEDSTTIVDKIINNEFEYLKYTGKDND
jgi:hypothetical protein